MPGRRSVSEPDVERGKRLSSWKEIAVYLNCGVRTVQRWEQIEGLPIRRHVHKTHATVHAYTAELDNWRERRTDVAPGEHATDAAPREKRGFVGRVAELTRLHEHMRCALGGTTQVVFVAGEMGIGKTALVRAFLDDIRSDALLIEGHCVQQYGAGEPYLPIIEGLTRVLRGRADHAVTQAFMRFAPTWVQQIPDLSRRALRREHGSEGRASMLRQFDDALDAVSRTTPVVLFLDDLQWSDWSTVELIDRIGRGECLARLFVLGTYRPDDLFYRHHPLISVEHELTMRGRSEQIQLRPLDDDAVAAYLAQHGTWKDLRGAAGHIHQWTGGNPLFMKVMLEDLVTLRRVILRDDVWDFTEDVQLTRPAVPQVLRDVLKDRLHRLSAQELQTLCAASVAGVEFSSGAVAAAVVARANDIEHVLQSLADRHQFIHSLPRNEPGPLVVDAPYAFSHSLYHNVVYDTVPPSSRVDYHRAIAAWLERTHERDRSVIAAELAMHYERARDADRASDYYHTAALTALSRSAGHEAIRCAEKSLDHLARLPAGAERYQRELGVRLTICAAASSMSTMVDPLVEQAYRDALTLCERVGDDAQLVPALLGIERFHLLRGDIISEPSLGDRALAIARTTRDPVLLAAALQHVATVRQIQGRFPESYACAVDAAAALSERRPESRTLAATGFGPVVAALTIQSHAAWFLGNTDECIGLAHSAVDHAHQLGHAQTLGFAQAWLAPFLELCGVDEGRAWAERALANAKAFDFAMVAFFAEGALGWILGRHGDPAGIKMIRGSLAFQREMGIRIWIPMMSWWLAEVLIRASKFKDALAAVEEGLNVSRETGTRICDAELHGVRSDALRQMAYAETPDTLPTVLEECDHILAQSLAIAREQGAKSLELRAALRRALLLRGTAEGTSAYEELSQLYAGFPQQDVATPDLIQTRDALRRDVNS